MTNSTITRDEAISTVAKYFRSDIRTSAKKANLYDFARNNFYIASTKAPMKLMPHQYSLLEYALDEDMPFTDGGTIIYSATKKAGKTAVSALVARWIAETWETSSEVYMCANDREQARGRAYQSLIDSIEIDPNYSKKATNGWKIIERGAFYEPNRSIVKALSSDYRGEAGSNPTATFFSELWAYTCLDESTQILTKIGWKSDGEITPTTEVATLSIDGFMEWQTPIAITSKPYDGEMVRFKHRRCDMLVTPNHRILADFHIGNSPIQGKRAANPSDVLYSNRFSHKLAEDASQYSGYIKADADWVGERVDRFILPTNPTKTYPMDLWARFFGWYIAEGCCQRGYKDRAYMVHIAQDIFANEEKFSEIEDLVNEMGLNHSADKDGIRIYDVELGEYLRQFGDSRAKYVPDEIKNLSKDQLLGFFLSYLSGDGWIAGQGFQCHTMSVKLSEDLMEIALKCGYIPSVIENKSATNGIIRLGFSVGPIAWQADHSHWSKEEYTGNVWCVTVPNSTIYVRRNGTCYWTGNSEASRRLYDELTPVPTRKRSVRYIETYAGFTDESDLLLDLYKLGMQGRRLTHSEIDWPFPDQPPVWVHERAKLFMYWDSGEVARRMPWQTNEYYETQAATLRPETFNRLHLNLWGSSTDSFLPEAWWNACYAHVPPITDMIPVVLGVDASVTGDCTALVGVTRDPDNATNVMLRFYEVWQPSKGSPMDLGILEARIRELATQYNIVEVAYDSYQLHKVMTDIRNDGVAWCRPFSQGSAREIADKALYDIIRDRRIKHSAGQQFLEHIQAAAAKATTGEKIRIVKKSNSQHVDLVVALSMAASECLRLLL